MESENTKPKVKPVVSEVIAPVVTTDFIVPAGRVHFAQADAQGKEIAGTDFHVTPLAAQRVYSNNPKFIEKKSKK